MPNLFSYLVAILFGLALGSFANVLVLRDEDRKSILTGRSQCPHCHKPLAWYELVPVLSFIGLRGRCSKCHKPISWQYPAVELAAAALFSLADYLFVIQRGDWVGAVLFALSSLLLLVVAVIDIRTMYVPVEYCVAAAVLGWLAVWHAGLASPLSSLLGLAAGAGIILAVIWLWRLIFRQEGMGSGDIWVAGAVGAVVGWPQIVFALAAAVFSGAVIGLALLPGSRKGLQLAIPFGPFLFFGMLAAFLWGDRFLSWYRLVTL